MSAEIARPILPAAGRVEPKKKWGAALLPKGVQKDNYANISIKWEIQESPALSELFFLFSLFCACSSPRWGPRIMASAPWVKRNKMGRLPRGDVAELKGGASIKSSEEFVGGYFACNRNPIALRQTLLARRLFAPKGNVVCVAWERPTKGRNCGSR